VNNAFLKLGFLIFISINISVLSGCFSSGESFPYYSISDEFAEYCWYEVGSSWSYQNDSTLVVESIVIDEVDETIRFNPEGVEYNYQAVDMYLFTNNLGFTKLEITAGYYKADPGEMNSLFRLYNDDGTYQLIFSPQYAIGEEIGLGDNIGTYSNLEIIDNLELLGNTYIDVYHSRLIIEVGTNIEYNYWIAKDYGLIKSVTSVDGQTISLSLKTANLVAH
jgi:hypothetical protein